MMRRLVRLLFRAFLIVLKILIVLLLVWAALAAIQWSKRPNMVMLPNGLILKSESRWRLLPPAGLFSKDGRTLLASYIEFVCFNDRYVYVNSYKGNFSGLYDADIEGRVTTDYSEGMGISGLSGSVQSCNGYYTGWLGADMMFDGQPAPFLPPCAWRNFENPALKDRAWFDRPCMPEGWAKSPNR